MKGDSILLFLILFPMAGAILSYLVGRKNKKARDMAAVCVATAEFIIAVALLVGVCQGKTYSFYLPDFCFMGISLELDGFRALYGLLAAFMWFVTTIFSTDYQKHHHNRNRYYLFFLLTLGATIGVFLSADLFTTFIFFEIMSFTSYVWVAQEETKEALRAAETYLAVAVIGGLVMLMGLFLLYHELGTLHMSELYTAYTTYNLSKNAQSLRIFIAGLLLLFGFGAKAGMFPLHIWLPKAHPVAPAPASALLSGMLTKTGIFGILVITSNVFLHDVIWGRVILILGIITMLGGAVLAVFSVDLKRTLACSSMSQIGFILVGIGMQCFLGEDNALAVRGTLLHMVNHSLIKLVLFVAAGVVFMNMHELNLNKLRGFGKKKPLFTTAFLMGTLGISGIPFWNGYVSKTLLHESIVEYVAHLEHHGAVASEITFFQVTEWLFLLAGGLTIAYMTKLCVALFIEKPSVKAAARQTKQTKSYMNKATAVVLAVSALILPILGCIPNVFMDGMADLGDDFMHTGVLAHAVSYFSIVNLSGAFISLAIGMVVYFGFIRTCLMKKQNNGVREYVDRWPKWLDLENAVYRPILTGFLPFVCAFFCRIGDVFLDVCSTLCMRTILAPRKQHMKIEVGNRFTHAIGTFMDFIVTILNRTIYKKKPIKHSFVSLFAVGNKEVSQTTRLFVRSVSFGLLMFCVGLALTLSYLLF